MKLAVLLRALPGICWAFACAAGAEDFMRGVTVSCQTSGVEWGRPEMAATMDDLKTLGTGWIAIHPYARIENGGGLRFPADSSQPQITRPLAWAKEKGLKVMLVPHIAYWGSQFSWRGDITFARAENWNRFFADYERWMVAMAREAEAGGAGMLCVGLEYTHAQKFEQRWRRIIAAVRAVYHGKLTYGANWNEIEKVPFWDALDYVGVLAYFPLSDAKDPQPDQLERGWLPWLERLGQLSAKVNRPVVFTEIGYDLNLRCAARPWEWAEDPQPAAAGLQCRCLAQALALEGRRPWLAGMFLWKWFPEIASRERETFDLRTPALRKEISSRWVRR